MAGKRFTVDAVFRGINKISKPARSMGRSISKFVRKSNRQIAKLGRKFKKLGSIMGKAIIGGAAVAAAAVGVAVVKTAELGDEAAKTGRRLGLTAEALQELRFAADRQGVSAGLLGSSFTALQKRVGELKSGTGSLFAFLKKTGDTAFIRQLKLAKSTEEAFELITKRTNEIIDPMKKAAFAAAAFSRSGIDMIKFMEAGTDGISKLRQEAQKYGAVISNEAAKNSELFIDSMTNMKATLGGVSKTIGSKLIPILTPMIQKFADFWALNKDIIGVGIGRFISGVGKAFNFLKPIVFTLFKVFKGLFSAFMGAVSSLLPSFSKETINVKGAVALLVGALVFLAEIGTSAFEFIEFFSPFLKPFIGVLLGVKVALIAIALGAKAWAIAQGILNAVLTANPISIIIIAISALVAGIIVLVQNWDTVVAAFKSGTEFIWGWFSGLLDNPFFVGLATIFLPFITVPALIFKHWEPIKDFFSSIWDIFSNGLNKAMESIAKISTSILSIPGVKSTIDFFTGGSSGAEAKPVTPQERLSRSIEEKQNNSTLTIQDRTGTAELSPQQKGGPQIALASSGGL